MACSGAITIKPRAVDFEIDVSRSKAVRSGRSRLSLKQLNEEAIPCSLICAKDRIMKLLI